MISPKAAASIAWLFERALRENSVAGPQDQCLVTRRPPAALPGDDAKKQLVVLSISSYVFRIVALFVFDTNPQTAAHFAKLARSTNPHLQGQALSDAYAELVNMICGAVNRGLRADFRHSGMSTPFVLESSCAQYVSILNPSQTHAFEVVVNDGVRFQLIVCTCVAGGANLDFDVDRSAQEEEVSGELELF